MDNYGIFPDVVGFANGVNDNKSDRIDGGFGTMPQLDTPIDINRDAATGGIKLEKPQVDPEVDTRNGFSRNYFLEQLRNQHPFVTIDPPYTSSVSFNMTSGDPEIVVQIPQNCEMYRVTYTNNAANSVCAISHQRGITISGGVALDNQINVIINPQPIWRMCRGVREIVLKTVSGANKTMISIEFFAQL